MAFSFDNAPLPTPITNGTTPDADQVQQHLDNLADYLNSTGWVTSSHIADGTIAAGDLSAALAAQLGVSAGGVVSRGQTTIATEESRTNTAYGTLTTPDQVASVGMPANGLMFITYNALWKASVGGFAAKAAVFIGANQLKVRSTQDNAAVTQAAVQESTLNEYSPLISTGFGLVGSTETVSGEHAASPTTGVALGLTGFDNSAPALYHELNGIVSGVSAGHDLRDAGVGGLLVVDNLAAGTYNVSVQFKSSSGSVTAKERRLKVWTVAF